MKNSIVHSFFACLLGFGIIGCGGSGSSQDTGTLEVGITDAPVDNAQAVVIHFTEATLHGPDGNTTVEVLDPATGEVGRSIDLMQLQGGMWTGLFDDIVVAGHYSWIRLTLDLSQSYIQIDDQQHSLRCTSCQNNGYRLNRSFNIDPDGTLALMIDFDLRKSITLSTSGTEYHLRPTLRVIEADVSGDISGAIDPNLIADLGGFSGCSVYAFSGNDALLDDVYIPMNMSMPMPVDQNNPVSTAQVVFENDTYSYTLSFLPAGNYTVALTCDADMDMADRDDELVFSDPINVPVVAGETSTADFGIAVIQPI